MSDRSATEADDVSRLQAEVDLLAEEIADLDLRLNEARQALSRFEAEYRQVIAGRLARVEALQARLSALQGQRDIEAEVRAEQAARVAEELTPEERRKSMVRRIHPDFAGEDVAEREAREDLMKRLNSAWDRQDWDEFDLVEAEVDRRTAVTAPPEERRAVLERAHRRLLRRLTELHSRLEQLQSTSIWELFERAEAARREGRDLLMEQAAELDATAATLEAELDRIEDEP